MNGKNPTAGWNQGHWGTTQRFASYAVLASALQSELNIDTICGLMCTKKNQDLNCFEYEPIEELLKSAKKAVLTYQSNLKKAE